jgi:ketosteroid isomerase-like protein
VAQPSNEEIVRRYLDAHAAHDYDTLAALRDPDWTWEWPQSGERVRGHANDRAIMDNWPGGLPSGEMSRVFGNEDQWIATPFNTLHRVIGNGDSWWADGTSAYPDGSTWFVVALLRLRGGRVHRETWYFAEPFEAPAWRAAWVERSR